MNRNEYFAQLKEITDNIRAKDPSEHTWEDKWYLWHERVLTSPPDAPFDFGEEIEIYDGEKLSSGEIKDGFGRDYPDWFQKMGKHFGKKCTAPNDKVYTLLGMSETFEDYYYILEGEDGKKSYHSCVGGLKFLD